MPQDSWRSLRILEGFSRMKMGSVSVVVEEEEEEDGGSVQKQFEFI